MENATKALLIAASVLIAIVLIAVGIKILSSTSGVTDQVDDVSDSMAKSVFNSQFTSYFNDSTSGTQAKALVQKIIANNSQPSVAQKVTIYCPDKSGFHYDDATHLQELYSWISTSKRYKIDLTLCNTYKTPSRGYNNGYIACITIDEL